MSLRELFGFGGSGVKKPEIINPLTSAPRQELIIRPDNEAAPAAVVPSTLHRLELSEDDEAKINTHLDATLSAYIQAHLASDPTAIANATLAIIRPIKNLGLDPTLPLDFLMKSLLTMQGERLMSRPENQKIYQNLGIIYANRFLTTNEQAILDGLGLENDLESLAERHLTFNPEHSDDDRNVQIANMQTPLYLDLISLFERNNLTLDQERVVMKYVGQKIMETMFGDVPGTVDLDDEIPDAVFDD